MMLIVELSEKDLMLLNIMIDSELKNNENMIVSAREDDYKERYLFIDILRQRNELLTRVKERLQNTKRCPKEVNEDVGD